MRRNLNLNTVTLWAMWYTKYGPTTMQGWKGCDQLQQHQTITLVDARDDNQYIVSKLKDGKCWMTQNLKIQDYEATAEDSDIGSSFYIPNNNNQPDAQSVICSATHKPLTHASTNLNRGVYYTYFSATAGSGDYKLSSSGGIASESICPRGWKIPSKQDAELFVNKYSYADALGSPLNFIIMGWYIPSSNSIGNDNQDVWYWLADTFTDNSSRHWAYELALRNNRIYVGQDCIEYGAPIRCIQR